MSVLDFFPTKVPCYLRGDLPHIESNTVNETEKLAQKNSTTLHSNNFREVFINRNYGVATDIGTGSNAALIGLSSPYSRIGRK